MLWLTLMSPSHGLDIPHETYQLDNGLRVILLEDHSLPQVVVDTWYGVGSYDDPEGASGFAHLFEHLMFMGTARIPEKEFDQRMEIAGGWNNATTGESRTNYYDVGPAELVDLLLFMEADRMTGLDITQRKLDLQREVVRNERRQNYEDRPYGKIWLEMPEMLYPPEHPYHLEGIGSHEDLLAATLDTVNNFYADWYRPNNATLCVAGDFDPEHVKARIEEWYGPLKAGKEIVHQESTQPVAPMVRDKTITDNVSIPALLLMWHSPTYLTPDDATADILATILAGSPEARLTSKLVYERRSIQDISVFQMSRAHGSVFMVYVDALPESNLDEITAFVHKELEAISSGEQPITSEELTKAVNNWEVGFLWGLEDLLDRAETLQDYQFHLGRTDFIEEDLQRYRDVTAESIQTLIGSYLLEEKSARLIVAPEPKEQETTETEEELKQ